MLSARIVPTRTTRKRFRRPRKWSKRAMELNTMMSSSPTIVADCGRIVDPLEELPPPLPDPKYSVRRRVLPGESLVAMDSPEGRRRLVESLQLNSAASYWSLVQHFCNQTDPAFCGVTTLIMVLNAMAVDPGVLWKGGWRYYGNESVLLSQCCLSEERVKRVGVTMEEFLMLSKCQGLRVEMKRPGGDDDDDDNDDIVEKGSDLEGFRKDIASALHENSELFTNTSLKSSDALPIMVVSFGRSALGQTGDGHFSPLAAYHASSDSVLVLDVARFKYPPYWVSVPELYTAMMDPDAVTQKPRGWYKMRPPMISSVYRGPKIDTEERRAVKFVRASGDAPSCPMHSVKVDYCKVNRSPGVP